MLRAGQRQTGQVTPKLTEQVTEQVARLVLALGEQTLSLRELMQALGLSHRSNFLALRLRPALDAQFLQMTQPDKPQSRHQKYRLTALGRHKGQTDQRQMGQ